MKHLIAIALTLLLASAATAQTADTTLMHPAPLASTTGDTTASAASRFAFRTIEVSGRIVPQFFNIYKLATIGVGLGSNNTFGVGSGVGHSTYTTETGFAHSSGIPIFLYIRRYLPKGKGRWFHMFEAMIGCNYVYSVDGESFDPDYLPKEHGIELFYSLQYSIGLRIWRDVNIFAGPNLGPSAIGIHLGLSI